MVLIGYKFRLPLTTSSDRDSRGLRFRRPAFTFSHVIWTSFLSTTAENALIWALMNAYNISIPRQYAVPVWKGYKMSSSIPLVGENKLEILEYTTRVWTRKPLLAAESESPEKITSVGIGKPGLSLNLFEMLLHKKPRCSHLVHLLASQRDEHPLRDRTMLPAFMDSSTSRLQQISYDRDRNAEERC